MYVQDLIMNERDILMEADNDFIVRCPFTFESRKYLYLVMEYMQGGDFANLLKEVNKFTFDAS